MINKKHIYLSLGFFSIVILFLFINRLFCYKNLNLDTVEKFTTDMSEFRKKLKFPYRFFRNENNTILPIVCITAFFRDIEQKKLFQELKNENILVVGCTAYKTFPKKIEDVSECKFHHTDDFKYTKEIKYWLSCFRKINTSTGVVKNVDVFDHNNILFDISESDFYDEDKTEPVNKKYDFIYVCNKDSDSCPKDGWNAICRNYDLAERCFPIMFNEYNLKGLIVGRVGCGLEKKYPNNVEITDFLPYFDLQQKMRESRFLFMPNIYDASPRIMVECIIKNVPVLLNKKIVCGFKYINYETGVLFKDEYDLKEQIDLLLNKINTINPKKWYISHFGNLNSSKKLRDFLYEASLSSDKYTHISNILKDSKQVFFQW